MGWALRFHGVGSSAAVELGSAMATIERDGLPWLTIDCGSEGLTACRDHYRRMPDALFITHTHLDHVGGMERLFVDAWFDPARRGRVDEGLRLSADHRESGAILDTGELVLHRGLEDAVGADELVERLGHGVLLCVVGKLLHECCGSCCINNSAAILNSK